LRRHRLVPCGFHGQASESFQSLDTKRYPHEPLSEESVVRGIFCGRRLK
jgi:hypothetical protein